MTPVTAPRRSRLAADAELALRSARPATVIALALGTESLLTVPTMQGDLALRHVLRLHPRTLARLDHEGTVNAVAFSPDGTRVATASSDDRRRLGAGIRRGHRGAAGPAGPRRRGERGGVQPGRHPGRHRAATTGSARVFDAATGEPSWPGWTTRAR